MSYKDTYVQGGGQGEVVSSGEFLGEGVYTGHQEAVKHYVGGDKHCGERQGVRGTGQVGTRESSTVPVGRQPLHKH